MLESGNIVGSAFVSAVAALVQEKLLLSVPSLARGSAKLLHRAPGCRTPARWRSRPASPARQRAEPGLEGLILVMPDPDGIAALVGHLLSEQAD